jgi:hypothetical protein
MRDIRLITASSKALDAKGIDVTQERYVAEDGAVRKVSDDILPMFAANAQGGARRAPGFSWPSYNIRGGLAFVIDMENRGYLLRHSEELEKDLAAHGILKDEQLPVPGGGGEKFVSADLQQAVDALRAGPSESARRAGGELPDPPSGAGGAGRRSGMRR